MNVMDTEGREPRARLGRIPTGSLFGSAQRNVPKLAIHNVKVRPQRPEDFAESAWMRLKAAVETIQRSDPLMDSMEELYKTCEYMCAYDLADSLYMDLQLTYELHLQEEAQRILRSHWSNHEGLLRIIDNAWSGHCQQMMTVRSIFLYLDRTYVLQTPGVLSLWEMGLDLFRRWMVMNPEIKKFLVDGLLSLIDHERKHTLSGCTSNYIQSATSDIYMPVDQSLHKGVLRMLVELHVYDEVFEQNFIAQSGEFYRAESHQLIQSLNVADYLKYCERRLLEECERVKSYLDSSTRRPLVYLVEQGLISANVSTLLEKGWESLLDQHAVEDLARFYQLFARVHTLDEMRAYLTAYLRKRGNDIVSGVTYPVIASNANKSTEKYVSFASGTLNVSRHPSTIEENDEGDDEDDDDGGNDTIGISTSQGQEVSATLSSYPISEMDTRVRNIHREIAPDETMVDQLLNLKDRMDQLWTQAFEENESFQNAIKEAFENIINSRANRPAELIAKYVDKFLRSGKTTASVEQLEELLDKVLVLFRFIQGKDVFEAFYKRDLAKRLLLGKSASFDAEKSMLSKLKTECGSQFTSKLETMFKDVELSRDIMSSFQQSKYLNQLKHQSLVELNVQVITMGMWPSFTLTETVQFPEELTKSLDVFRTFYLSKHYGRRLTWQHSLGTCVLRANFPRGRKELSVSFFQAVVLLLFNENDDSHQSTAVANTSLGPISKIHEPLSYSEIARCTNIEDKELKRTLQSLACGKVRVLNKFPRGRDVKDDDTFTFNEEFSHPRYRVHINQIQLKESTEENQVTTEKVAQDRQYQLDAAIVRIMKARKSLLHSLLVAELYESLKFPISPADIKKRIESLIDRDYLERDKETLNLYHYLA